MNPRAVVPGQGWLRVVEVKCSEAFKDVVSLVVDGEWNGYEYIGDVDELVKTLKQTKNEEWAERVTVFDRSYFSASDFDKPLGYLVFWKDEMVVKIIAITFFEDPESRTPKFIFVDIGEQLSDDP